MWEIWEIILIIIVGLAALAYLIIFFIRESKKKNSCMGCPFAGRCGENIDDCTDNKKYNRDDREE